MRTFGRNFWRQAVERAIKTAAQAGVLALGADAANKIPSIVDSPGVMLYALAGGFLASLLTSIATAGVGQKDDPSAVATVGDGPGQPAANGL
jgi:hypothetical protein